MAGGKPDGSSHAATLILRIATVGLSVAAAAMMASASCHSCAGCAPAASQVSYSDYSSLKYSLAAMVMSAVLQAAAACLTAHGKEDQGKAAKSVVELMDTAAQVFLYSSSALSFSVDDFGTCGHRVAGVCKSPSKFCFCQRAHVSGALSMAAAVALAASNYLKEVPVSTWFKGDEHKAKTGCGRSCHCHH